MERKPRNKIKTTKNLQGESTITRILNQATRLFLERGYHGTSIDNITRAAGVTKGALYWHFKGKEDLLKRIVDEFETRFLEGLIHEIGEVKGGALDKFDKYIHYNAAFAYNNRELCVSFTTLSAELLGANPRQNVEGKIRKIYRRYQDFLSSLVDSGKEENVFKKEANSKLAALVIMALHDGVLLHWSMNRKDIDGKAYVDTFKNIIKNGLLAPR
jgi:AcrR family transcriptional regulator